MKILKQETDKSCGIACIRSAMNHLGKELSEKEIWDKNESLVENENMLNPILNLGITTLKFGFKVKYLNYHPVITNNNQEEDLKKSLELKSKSYIGFGKYYVEKALEFINLGGEIIIDKFGVENIKKLLDENEFVIVEIKPAFLNKTSSINMNHKVIVSGYTENSFKVLFPDNCKEYEIDFNSFLLAFYAAIPEMLIIKKN